MLSTSLAPPTGLPEELILCQANVSTDHPLFFPQCSGVTGATGVTGAAGGGAACGGQEADGDACHPAVKSPSSVSHVCLFISLSLFLVCNCTAIVLPCRQLRPQWCIVALDVVSSCVTETDRCSGFCNSHDGHQRLHISWRMTSNFIKKNKKQRKVWSQFPIRSTASSF